MTDCHEARDDRRINRSFKKPGLRPTQLPREDSVVPIECPCCKHPVDTPSIDIVVDHYQIPPHEARILRAVWRGKGHPVETSRIFDAMYVDDPDGGPEPSRMYAAFKAGLHNLRCRLVRSGIAIESVGYRRGFRIVIGSVKNTA